MKYIFNDTGISRQPDDPGHGDYPEPDVGHYPGWLTFLIWAGLLAIGYAFIAFGVRWLMK